jgi:hypothetical protein
VVHELIDHDAGAKTPEGRTVTQLHHLIPKPAANPSNAIRCIGE